MYEFKYLTKDNCIDKIKIHYCILIIVILYINESIKTNILLNKYSIKNKNIYAINLKKNIVFLYIFFYILKIRDSN